jgi:hypothetical protein
MTRGKQRCFGDDELFEVDEAVAMAMEFIL